MKQIIQHIVKSLKKKSLSKFSAKKVAKFIKMSRTHISSGIMSRMRVFESTDSTASNTDSPTKRSTTVTSAASTSHSPTILTSSVTLEKAELREPGFTANTSQQWFEQKRQAISSALEASERSATTTTMMMSSPPPGVQKDAEGLILPRKLINPCMESNERQQLHRELKFNNKIGKSVLNQKSELQRAYEKQRERQQRQQQQEDLSPTAGLKAELNRVIMERAQKHERQEGGDEEEDKQYVNPEYLNARAKLRQQRASELK